MKIKNYLGFTLVELMVVVAISMVLMGAGMVAYNSYNSREKTNQAASEIVSQINLAKSTALTNQIAAGFVDSLDYVAVVLENGTISAFPVNMVSGIGSSYFSKEIIDDGIVISNLSFGDLQFGATTGKLLLKDADPSFNANPLSASEVGISLTIASNAEGDDQKMILVTPAGIIKLSTIEN
jgi:type II secretory pathway pseudopilin PulG